MRASNLDPNNPLYSADDQRTLDALARAREAWEDADVAQQAYRTASESLPAHRFISAQLDEIDDTEREIATVAFDRNKQEAAQRLSEDIEHATQLLQNIALDIRALQEHADFVTGWTPIAITHSEQAIRAFDNLHEEIALRLNHGAF